MTQEHMFISIHTSLGQVTEAVTLLQTAGYEGHSLSMLGRNAWSGPPHRDLGHLVGDALEPSDAQASGWARIWSTIPGRGGFWIYEDGPLLAAGRVVDTLAAVPAEQMVPGGRGLEMALTHIGIPESSASPYAAELTNRRLLLIVHGSLEATDRAQRLLSTMPVTNHTLHHGASE